MSEEFDEEYEERRRRRNARNEEMRRRKKQQQMVRMLVRRLLPIAGIILVAVILMINGRSIVRRIQGYSTPTKNDTSVAASPAVSEDVTQVSEDSTGDLQAEADEAHTENVVNTETQQGQASADEVNLKLRQLATNDHKQQVILLGVQASLPDMTALLGQAEEEQAQAAKEQKVYTAQATDATTSVDDEVQSTNGIFIDLATGNILFDRDSHTRINPASMTKVLTVLVAAEHVTDWSDTFEITPEITNYSYVHDCSAVGFSNNEVVTVEDLFYGTVLCSGGDAALGLATYVAGSQEAFVDMMNEKLKELGLSDTAHFTNCVGLYDENHYCTVYDIAMILEAAIDNPQCREVLSTKKYTTSSTPEHPEGIQISNWFLRRIEDKDTGGEVICGKTGFVAQSGSCAVSYGKDAAGNEYICATVNAHSGWRCIYDHVELYKRFAKSADGVADE
ncbi:MAG: serine hydrolase [Lachnospiraceae bacterium]|nr:serine hydrolase [Lachnospiraceae bacterium]